MMKYFKILGDFFWRGLKKFVSKEVDYSQHSLDSEDSVEDLVNGKASSEIPSGYKIQNGCLYWGDKCLDLPGVVWETFLYKNIFIVTCKPRSSLANVSGFDLKGNRVWTIAPVPYPAGTPAYQFVRWSAKWNALLVLEGRGEFELDFETGKILRQVSGSEK